MPPFRNRTDAGQQLATRLTAYADRADVLVLALPRGGVPVAVPVAQRLHAPLDVFLVRKLGVPGHEELAMGAIASGGVRVLLQGIVKKLGIPGEVIEAVVEREEQELARRERAYRADRPFPSIRGRTIILIDDGLATGATMWAAVAAVREQEPGRLVVAVPVAAPATCRAMRDEVDEIICAVTPRSLGAVGQWYADFSPTTDEEVSTLLAHAAAPLG